MKKQKCISCGKMFELTETEIAFFSSRNLSLPKRCKECREIRNEIKTRSEKSLFVNLFEKIVTNKSSLAKAQNNFKYKFKSNEEFKEHFIKHGRECNCNTPKKYLKTANKIIKSKTTLKKTEKDDGDTVYFNKKTGGIVFLSPKGYIRSFYIADSDYFKRQ